MKAVYPGTFDPLTNGHLDIILRSCRMFEHLFVCVAVNLSKQTLLTLEERLAVARSVIADAGLGAGVSVGYTSGLLVDYVKSVGAGVIVRGIRAASDFDYEFQMACTNRSLSPSLQTVFLPSSYDKNFVSSAMVRSVCALGGDVSCFVPPASLGAMVKALKIRSNVSP